MPTAEAPSIPREMSVKLASVRHRIHGVQLGLAAERALLALVGGVVLSFLLDSTLEPELAVRRPFTWFLFVSAAAAGAAFVVSALRRRLTDDDVAVLVEQVYPELENGLVSSVQLGRDLDRGGLGHTSPALIRSVIARTAQKSHGLDFGRVVDPSPLLPATFLTIAAIGLIAVFAVHPATRPLADAWFQRCVLGNAVSYPKAIELSVMVAGEQDGVTAVARGDDVTVEIGVPRGRSKVERLLVRTYPLRKDESSGRYYLTRARPEETRLSAAGTADAKFRKIYQNVTEPFEFVVDAGHHVVSSRHRVVVVDRPRVEEARFWLTYPEYTGIAATAPEKPETQPDLRVPVGTEIRYRVTSNKPLSRAELVFEYDDPKAPKPAAGQPQPTIEEVVARPEPTGTGKLEKRILEGSFQVKRTMRFRYSLRSVENYDDGKKPVVFSVTAVVDRPPDVKIPVPGRPKQVVRRALVPIEVEIKDDYGIVQAELRLKLETTQDAPRAPGAPAAKQEERIALAGLEDAAKSALLKHRLDLAELGLHAGDRVIYRAVAFDRNIDTEKRVGESTTYLLQVVADEDMKRILQDRLQRVKEDLLATAKLQKQAREDTDGLVRALVAKTKLEEEDKRKILLADFEQRKVTSRLASAAQEVERLVEERELNRLDDTRELGFEQKIREALKELAERASPAVSRELDDTRRAPELDERTKARLARVPDLQADLERTIEAVARRIDERADFGDMIRDVQEILSEQERVLERTEAELKKSGGREK